MLHSVGVDSWAVDYGLLDASDRLIEEPICYRDERTSGVMDDVLARVPREEIFARTGHPVSAAEHDLSACRASTKGFPAQARRLLLIPDLCHHFLCGSRVGERTNASTTQLLDVRTGAWDDELFDRLGLGAIRPLMPDLSTPAPNWALGCDPDAATTAPRPARDARDRARDARYRERRRRHAARAGLGVHFVRHVVAGRRRTRRRPARSGGRAREVHQRERRVDGTVRFLTNVMGLWLLESCRKEWTAAGIRPICRRSCSRVAAVPGFVGFVCPDAPRFFNPPHMTRELQSALAESGQTAHDDPVLLAKVILDSLAARYASVIDTIERLTSRPISGIHIVGGGSQNA